MARGVCGTCGSSEALRADGTVRAHRQLRMGRAGQHRAVDGCPGSGEPPEPDAQPIPRRGNARAVPFEGAPPAVGPGDRIEVRSAGSEWRPAVARSEPRYDWSNCIGGRCHLTVSVSVHGYDSPLNWPAEAVRPVAAEAGGV